MTISADYMGSAGLKGLDFDDSKAFWQRVNRRIKEKKLNQEIVASRCDTFYSTFRNWSFRKSYPDLPKIFLMSQVLEVSMNYLIFGQESEPRTEFEYVVGKKVLSLVDNIALALKNGKNQ